MVDKRFRLIYFKNLKTKSLEKNYSFLRGWKPKTLEKQVLNNQITDSNKKNNHQIYFSSIILKIGTKNRFGE